MRIVKGSLATIVLIFLVPPPAHAYLDPAAGSMLLQLILGGLAGVALAIKVFWHRIVASLGFFFRRNERH